MKYLVMVVLILAFVVPCYAEELSISDTFKKIPTIDNGGYFSLLDSKFNYSATFKVLQTKDQKFALNFGYAGRAKESLDKVILTVSGSLLKLKDYVDVPILDLIIFDPYISAGFGRINLQAIDEAEFDLGAGANIIKIRF